MYITGDDVQEVTQFRKREPSSNLQQTVSVLMIVSGWWFFTEIPRGCCDDALATTRPWPRTREMLAATVLREEINRTKLQNCACVCFPRSFEFKWFFFGILCIVKSLIFSRYFHPLPSNVTSCCELCFSKKFQLGSKNRKLLSNWE